MSNNYSEQMCKLADDYSCRRIARPEYLMERRRILVSMDVAMNGSSPTQLTNDGEDITQPKFARNGDDMTQGASGVDDSHTTSPDVTNPDMTNSDVTHRRDT